MKKPYDIRERSFQFALQVIKLSNNLKVVNNEFVLSKQLMRSGTSVGALIREAKNAESAKDFIHKMAISQKECDETIYWVELIMRSNFDIDKMAFSELKDEAEQLLKIIKTIILNKKQNSKS